MNFEEYEIRPGGMLIQKRNSDSNPTSLSVSTIKVRVKYGFTNHEVHISSTASFGELKKILAELTGLHYQDQKLIYKKKERDSKQYLDVAGVKNGSKLVLVDDIGSRERRFQEMIRNAKIEKASKSLSQIRLQVDNFAELVADLGGSTCRGEKIREEYLDNLIGMLMTEQAKLDEIAIEGDLKLQKRMQPSNSTPRSNAGKIPLQEKR